jgi:GGDEF domain-containing protein
MAAAMAEGIARVNRQDRMAVRATRASALNEAGVRMISAHDVAEVARLATSSAAMILEAEHAVLRLQDEQTLRYVIRSYFGPADGRQQERLFRLDKSVSVESIRRRTPVIMRDLDQHDQLAEHAGEVRSLLSAPLKRDGRVVGTLSIYDKVAPERFYPIDFNEDDFQVFGRLVAYVERAIENSLFHAFMHQHRNFDEQTGLPNGAYVAKRIHEEIARSSGRQFALAVATCEIENLDEILASSNGAHVHRVIMRVADALRANIRDFDILARTSKSRFTILLPDPGHSPDQRVAELAQHVADTISKDSSLAEPHSIALAFGHAVHPGDGTDRESLIARAEAPRIRLV